MVKYLCVFLLNFISRLKNEKIVVEVIEKLVKYMEERGTGEEICRTYLRKIEHFYYKVYRV